MSEEGDSHTGPKQTEVPVAERREQIDPREATRTVETLVTVLIRPRLADRSLASHKVLDQQLTGP